MKNLYWPVYGSTSILLVYTLSPFLGFSFGVVFSLFLLMIGLLIWMVIRVLKDGEPSKATFEERWYDDYEGRSRE